MSRIKIFYFSIVALLFISANSFSFNIIKEDSIRKTDVQITNGKDFKTGSGNVFKTAKWIFPALTLITGGGYFFFDKKADDNYQNYINSSNRELAVNYRTKTKDNDQLANICGISAVASAIISVAVWIFDRDEAVDSEEEYKFIMTYGRQLTGYIIREDFDSYLIQTKEGAITVKRSDIARIEKDGLIIYGK